MEVLKPNQVDCKECAFLLKKGDRIADRFPILEDSCLWIDAYKGKCESVKSSSEAYEMKHAYYAKQEANKK